jgi:hypothetical protein
VHLTLDLHLNKSVFSWGTCAIGEKKITVMKLKSSRIVIITVMFLRRHRTFFYRKHLKVQFVSVNTKVDGLCY